MVTIKLEKFEGPLDLLLQLVEKSEVDIYEISIAQIVEQFLKQMSALHELELEAASEFLVMAATLISIKSRMLLPKTPIKQQIEQIADPREELIERLLNYKHFMRMGQVLQTYEDGASKIYCRLATQLSPLPAKLTGLTADDLLSAMLQVLHENKSKMPMKVVQGEEYSVYDLTKEIESRITDKPLSLTELIKWRSVSKEYIVTIFLAVLELMRSGKVCCYQEQLFADIFIRRSGQNEGCNRSSPIHSWRRRT